MLDRLSWTIDIDEDYREVALPKLLVQPLVENAILHGVEQRHEQGMVQVVVHPSSRVGYILITISDNGPGMSSSMIDSIYFALREGYVSSPKGNGVGIVNVERRLRLYYGDKTEGLIIHSEEGQGTTISFEIPNTPYAGKGT
jgi:two-component system sensor histidine kinase YesM